jgi:hypothetical protein
MTMDPCFVNEGDEPDGQFKWQVSQDELRFRSAIPVIKQLGEIPQEVRVSPLRSSKFHKLTK